MMVLCPCCQGKGEVEDEPPIKLTPLQEKIYSLVARCRLGGHEVVARLYGHDPDGGPDYALESVHVHINKMNKRLAIVGKKVVSTHRGPGGTYKIINVV